MAKLIEIFGPKGDKTVKFYIEIKEDEISETLLIFQLGF